MSRLRNKVFISYRRSDSAEFTTKLDRVLVEAYGREQVYLDVRGNEPGADWSHRITNAFDEAAAVLVVIGSTWAARFHERPEDDWIRYEVRTALKIDAARRVIPVLADTSMPSIDVIPEELRRLASLQAFPMNLRPYEWGPGCRLLLRELDRLGVEKKKDPEERQHHVIVPTEKYSEIIASTTPQQAGEALCYLLNAWSYKILSINDEDASISFHWGSFDNRAGKAVRTLYGKLDENGTVAIIDRDKVGTRVTLHLPSARRIALSAIVVYGWGVPMYGAAALWDRRLARGLFSALRRQLSGQDPGPDPLLRQRPSSR